LAMNSVVGHKMSRCFYPTAVLDTHYWYVSFYSTLWSFLLAYNSTRVLQYIGCGLRKIVLWMALGPRYQVPGGYGKCVYLMFFVRIAACPAVYSYVNTIGRTLCMSCFSTQWAITLLVGPYNTYSTVRMIALKYMRPFFISPVPTFIIHGVVGVRK